jgi:hypothetical protein
MKEMQWILMFAYSTSKDGKTMTKASFGKTWTQTSCWCENVNCRQLKILMKEITVYFNSDMTWS